MEAFFGFLSDVHLAEHKECPQHPLHLARRIASKFIGNHAGLAFHSSMSGTENSSTCAWVSASAEIPRPKARRTGPSPQGARCAYPPSARAVLVHVVLLLGHQHKLSNAWKIGAGLTVRSISWAVCMSKTFSSFCRVSLSLARPRRFCSGQS